jgi:hypothetical protein
MDVQADTVAEGEVMSEALTEEEVHLEGDVDTVGVELELAQAEREGDTVGVELVLAQAEREGNSVELGDLVEQGVVEGEEETVMPRELLLVMDVQEDTVEVGVVVGKMLGDVMDEGGAVPVRWAEVGRGEEEKEGDTDGEGLEDGCEAVAE